MRVPRSNKLNAALARLRAGLAPATIVIAIASWHAWWLHRFRTHGPLDTDEMGYMSSSFAYAHAFDDGPQAVWHLWTTSVGFGPLVPLVASPIAWLGDYGYVTPMLVQSIFLGLLAWASFGLLRAWGADRVLATCGMAATLLVPITIDFARTFHFVVAATACFVLVLFAHARSDGLRNHGWAAILGIAAGLMVLTRSMMLVYLLVPVVLALGSLLERGELRRRLEGLRTAVLYAVVTAGSWYLYSWRHTWDYLTGFGYGNQSENYGAEYPLASLGYWTRQFTLNVVTRGLYVPLAATVILLLVIGVVVRARRESDRRTRIRVTAVVIATVAVYAFLSTSRNSGTGFGAPYTTLLLIGSVAAAATLPARARMLFMAAVLSCTAWNTYTKSNLGDWPKEPMAVTVPGTDTTLLTQQPFGIVQQYVTGAGRAPSTLPSDPLPREARGWLAATGELLTSIDRQSTSPLGVIFGSRHVFFNSNALQLVGQARAHPGIPVAQLGGTQPKDDADAYARELESLAANGYRLLVTQDETQATFPPQISASKVEAAARTAGFEPVSRITLPTGEEARLWKSTIPPSR